ncbi:MAG TPA: 1,2-phenylacetyl-CoA epoxidase subunit PaaC [Flavisolibacter sp.]|jgi:ring-1,2-phenylacetyl-CoA epoxidase subunit PaaC|nr:1,2-phenylacetyl-CoA epoxidase subunit PaaC [Flavisolibacter sp.]
MAEEKTANTDLDLPFRGTEGFLYTLHLADNALILAQRNSEWTGHGPVLEQDIAITNIALDLLGQARNFYQHAATIYNESSTEEKVALEKYIPRLWKTYHRELQEDDLAFLRDEHQYLNVLLAELPRGDWSFTVLRQFFFSAYQHFLYRELKQKEDAQLAAIAEKSSKEVAYHLRWSSEWVIRLGDGTEESNRRIREALSDLWMFTGELFLPAGYEQNNATLIDSLKEPWMQKVQAVFEEAGLEVPKQTWSQSGGKEGRHTEHLGYLLAEMQYLQRTYPNATW